MDAQAADGRLCGGAIRRLQVLMIYPLNLTSFSFTLTFLRGSGKLEDRFLNRMTPVKMYLSGGG